MYTIREKYNYFHIKLKIIITIYNDNELYVLLLLKNMNKIQFMLFKLNKKA